MLELKYFKELPCRTLNTNTSCIQLAGADIYNDKDGNRYAFISVKNNYHKPFFSLYLYIKEYDSSGTFLKENKFSIPNIYGTRGVHVINEPILLEKGCDGIEVFIYFAEFTGRNFYNDKFTKTGDENIKLDLSNIKTQAKAATNVQKTTRIEPTVEASYEDDEEVEEVQKAIDVNTITSTSVVTKQPRLLNFATLIFIVIAIIIFVIFFSLIPQFVNAFNDSLTGSGGGGFPQDW